MLLSAMRENPAWLKIRLAAQPFHFDDNGAPIPSGMKNEYPQTATEHRGTRLMQRLTSMILPLALLLFAAPAFAQDESEMEEQQGSEVQEQVQDQAESADETGGGVREQTQDDMDSKQNRRDKAEKDSKDKKDKKAKRHDDEDRNATGDTKRSERAERRAERERMRELKNQCKQDAKEQKLRGQERKAYIRECMADSKQ